MDSSRRRFVGACLAAPVLAREATSAGAQRESDNAWRSSFPSLRQSVNGRPLTYLDSAATTLRPQSVIDALVQYYSMDNANPSRVHTLAGRAADRLAAARQTVARFVNATDASEIVFVRGTTEGVNLVASTWGAANLKSGDEIVLSVAEHSSNLLPWTRLARECGASVRVVDVTDEGRLEPATVERALSRRTRLVALTHVSKVLGAAK
jgi:cysteine desulfurase/selenocysteine lyase